MEQHFTLDAFDQRRGEPIGAAGHLEHAVLVVVVGLQVQADLRAEKIAEVDRLRLFAFQIAGTGLHRVTTARRPVVPRLVVERAGTPQILDQLLGIVLRQRRVERFLRQRLAKKLRDVAVEIRPGLTGPYAAIGQMVGLVLIQKGAVALVDERLDRHAQLAAVLEGGSMMVRDAHRTGVVVQPFVERADLRRTVLLADRATADREYSAARSRTGLEDLTGITKLSELVRHGEPGDSRSDNDHANRR